MCCGTKRLTAIQCPSDCVYLASAREHPPAAVVRRQEQDVDRLVPFLRDLNARQSQLFFLIGSFLARYKSPELQALIDDDVAEAAAALAATFETAARGVIYDHRPSSLPADRLATGIKALLTEAAGNGGSAFDRDAAVVVRRVERAARDVRKNEPANRSAFLDLLGRMIRTPEESSARTGAAAEPSRLIVP
ncbi:MAG TPA: hypothetical protein VGJ88_04370 [Thermoanaerobaculia bacterium]